MLMHSSNVQSLPLLHRKKKIFYLSNVGMGGNKNADQWNPILSYSLHENKQAPSIYQTFHKSDVTLNAKSNLYSPIPKFLEKTPKKTRLSLRKYKTFQMQANSLHKCATANNSSRAKIRIHSNMLNTKLFANNDTEFLNKINQAIEKIRRYSHHIALINGHAKLKHHHGYLLTSHSIIRKLKSFTFIFLNYIANAQ
jgi:hypothetical protein